MTLPFLWLQKNHQIRHQATHNMGCRPGDWRCSVNLPQGFVWVCMGWHALYYLLEGIHAFEVPRRALKTCFSCYLRIAFKFSTVVLLISIDWSFHNTYVVVYHFDLLYRAVIRPAMLKLYHNVEHLTRHWHMWQLSWCVTCIWDSAVLWVFFYFEYRKWNLTKLNVTRFSPCHFGHLVCSLVIWDS